MSKYGSSHIATENARKAELSRSNAATSSMFGGLFFLLAIAAIATFVFVVGSTMGMF